MILSHFTEQRAFHCSFFALSLEFLPVAFDVATFTLRTETTLVHIVLEVAGDTYPAQLSLANNRLFVTVIARRFLVRAIECKACLRVVKIPGLPGSRVVAGFAFGPQTPLVLIVLFMTGIAGRWRITESRRQVTLLALDLGMTAR